MTDITKHPLLAKCSEVIRAIEACGAGQEQTQAVIYAMQLMSDIEAHVDAQAQDAERCVWTTDCENVYETSCGQAFELNDGTPAENRMDFCCYCGKRIADDAALQAGGE